MTKEDALKILGAEALREMQADPLESILNRRDTFVRMATAGGKSLLFQTAAIMWEPDITLVFTPLKSLQLDQVQRLQQKGIRARYLNSSLSACERTGLLDDLKSGQVTLLYLAPEQLENKSIRKILKELKIAFVAVDEAHILAYSKDGFRRAYRKIGKFIAKLPVRPVIAAFTATATAQDQKVICQSLKMEDPAAFTSPIRRENLNLCIKVVEPNTKEDKMDKIWHGKLRAVRNALEDWNGKGTVIIYCTTVEDVKELFSQLQSDGWNVGLYYGKMPDKDREKAQADFVSGKIEIMVATNAFGLGIDKPDVRLLIHVGLPLSMDGYVQEIGRAGRDGKKSKCVLIYSPSDFTGNERILKHKSKKKEVVPAMARLNALKDLVASEKCLWVGIERYFGEKPGKKCGNCCICRCKELKRRSKK